MQTPLNFAIDFDAIRAALVAAAMQACALEQGRVVVAEPEVSGCRPGKPYVTIKVMTPAARYASDSLDVGEGGVAVLAGPRAMTVSFNCYGQSHEQAYAYMALLQARLDGDPAVRRTLGLAGVAVWKPGAVADMSQLVNTAFEGRAHMDVTFGLTSSLAIDVGSMEHATIEGDVAESDSDPAISI